MYCPYCGTSCSPSAAICPKCGHPIAERLGSSPAGRQPPVLVVRERKWHPGIAAVLSFFVPGLGQLYKGRFFAGLFWFLAVGLGYILLVIPGVILHIFCVLFALGGDPYEDS
jgi:TM2 domain-containing membrane protein YozV